MSTPDHEKISTTPKKIATPTEKCQPDLPNNPTPPEKISSRSPKKLPTLPKKCHLYRKNLTPPPRNNKKPS